MRYLSVALATFLTLTGGDPRRASAADEFGSLLVESDPAGAWVYVDGRLAGETPLTLPAIAAGVHRVRLVRLGYLENSRLVTVTREARATVHARLTDPAPQTSKAAALKIVVLEGEGAVNVIQQKTAVAPVIEVRDRNDQPVSSAVVKFAIRGKQATFSGARTLTVTTDAAGRAAVTSLTPTGSGALHITATAAFQGQTAVATIAQTNVLTAAQAASIASASAGGSGSAAGAGASAGGAGGGGGGLSASTVAIVGGAAAGAAVTAKKLVGGNGDVYEGPFSGPFVGRITTQNGFCTAAASQTGKIQITLTSGDADAVSGSGQVNATATPDAASSTCGGSTAPQPHGCCNPAPQLSGTRSNLAFSGSHPSGDGTSTWSYEFSGALNGSQVTGTFRFTISGPGATGSATFPVTLQRQ
jgi:hypothetical protein